MPNAEVLIIGAGPIGLEVAWHLKSAGIGAVVVDAGSIGETILKSFPPGTRFFSSPERISICGIDIPLSSQEKTTGESYLGYLRSVVMTCDLTVRTHLRIESLSGSLGEFTVQGRHRAGHIETWQAGMVVLACGGTNRPRRLQIPGEDLPHVHTLLGNPHQFFKRRVLVVGGRNSAAESALRCWRSHATVGISYRGDALHERVKYWIRPELQSLIDEGRVTSHMPTKPIRITPEHITLECLHSGDQYDIEVDDVLLQIGFEQDDHLFKLAGVICEGPQLAPQHDAVTMETNVPGIYVAGTAAAGTQRRFTAYIETSHDHGARIAAAMTGTKPPAPSTSRSLPES